MTDNVKTDKPALVRYHNALYMADDLQKILKMALNTEYEESTLTKWQEYTIKMIQYHEAEIGKLTNMNGVLVKRTNSLDLDRRSRKAIDEMKV